MDTKLKNNKNLSFIIAINIIILSAVIFTLFYPTFERKADSYYTKSFPNENILESLYKTNYVLYKDLMDKVKETNMDYNDLFLQLDVVDIESFPEEMDNGYYTDDIVQIAANIESGSKRVFSDWRREALNGITQQLDYCVIDHKTGQMVKNTGRQIELLNEAKDSDYDFYIKMTFDGAGNLDKVAVRSVDSDDLLKNVQRVMKSNRIFDYLPYINNNEVIYGYDSYETVPVAKSIISHVKSPENVTFIYAMTKEQINKLSESSMMGDTKWEEWLSYYNAGVAIIYEIMLVIMAVIILVFAKLKWNSLYKVNICKMPIEISITAGLIIIAGFSRSIVILVNDSNRGYFNAVYSKNFGFLSSETYPMITYVINILLLCLLFAAWYLVISSFGAVFEYGIKEFIKERSLIVRSARWIFKFCKRYLMLFKYEILHADLAQKEKKLINKIIIINFISLAIICSMWVFGWFALVIYSVILYIVLTKYFHKVQEQYRRLLKVSGSIAEGNLNTTFDEDLGVFESYKGELLKIQEGLRKAVDEEVKSQRMKTELITNVSHDLKTPLTAITTYIELLKEEGVTSEQQKEYIGVLEKKSLRLKFLIEDLFEVSKANSRNVTMNLIDVDIVNLIRQVYLEYEDKVEEADLIFRFQVPEDKLILKLDSQKTYRIFENLYINIIKYAMPHTRVYVNVNQLNDGIQIEFKNMSATELNIAPEELTERFVRGDSSRNTEGSGLGLAIARSFTELQGGRLDVNIDGDLFKVTIRL